MDNNKAPEPTAEDIENANKLTGLEYLDAPNLRQIYRNLSANYYAAMRRIALLQAQKECISKAVISKDEDLQKALEELNKLRKHLHIDQFYKQEE